MGYVAKEGEIVPSKLICKVCKNIVRQAILSKGDRFCHSCFEESLPCLVPTVGEGNHYNDDIATREEVSKLSVIIKCCQKQCPWEGRIREWEEVHSTVCEYMLILCPQCSTYVPRYRLKQHQHVCPCRMESCEHCGREMPLQQMGRHWEECPDFGERYRGIGDHRYSFPAAPRALVSPYGPPLADHLKPIINPQPFRIAEQEKRLNNGETELVTGIHYPLLPHHHLMMPQQPLEEGQRFRELRVTPALFNILGTRYSPKRYIRVHI